MTSVQRFFVLLQLILTCMATAMKQAPQYLNITAISTVDNASILECWELSSPFETSSEPGVAGAAFAQLGDGGAVSYAIIPADFDGGRHNAPVIQYVAFLSGLAVISLPNSTQTATIHGGKNGLIIATDMANVSTYGHITTYPSSHETHAIQIPTLYNKIPAHIVLYEGPCLVK